MALTAALSVGKPSEGHEEFVTRTFLVVVVAHVKIVMTVRSKRFDWRDRANHIGSCSRAGWTQRMTVPASRAAWRDDPIRERALAASGLFGTGPERNFDDLAVLAAQVCETPIAYVSAMASERQWLKAKVGIAISEMPVENSFCVHTMQHTGLFMILDLSQDPRTATHAFVTEPPFARFYAALRIHTPDQQPVGTLCVMDYDVRQHGLTKPQSTALTALARQVECQIALRQSSAELDRMAQDNRRGGLGGFSENVSQFGWMAEPGGSDAGAKPEVEQRLRELNNSLEVRIADALAHQAQTDEVLRQAHKMEAVGQLTGGIAHDFNNHLTAVSGNLELLSIRLGQGRTHDLQRYIDIAQGAVRRAATLTQRLLAFSRRTPSDPMPTHLDQVVFGIDDMIRRTLGPAIQLEIVSPTGLWSTLVDPNQVENALLNLCINAHYAMPEGGCLTIAIENLTVRAGSGADVDVPPGQYVALSVRDTGIGMAPEVIARAFDPFFTTKPIGIGTGLGLSMVHSFARQAHGHAKIESAVGRGTTVSIYLPRHSGEDV